MKLTTVLVLLLLSVQLLFSQTTVDPCFSSCSPGTGFASSGDVANTTDADLIQWTGSSWTGGWGNANLTIPPPTGSVGCRAMFLGNGVTWTSGGEGFGVRFVAPMVTGQVYTFAVTYVSHGFGSTGAFTPFVYTNSSPSIGGGVSLGTPLPPAGFTWMSSILSITATALQNGHNWLLFHSGSSAASGTGLVSSFCANCAAAVNSTCAVNLGTNTAICPGQSLALNAFNPGGSYQWQNNTILPTFTVTNPGTYWVKVTVGTCVAMDTIVVSNAAPTPTVNSNAPLCSGLPLQLSALGGTAYAWTGPGGFNSSVQNPTINPAGPANSGIYTVTISSASGCTLATQVVAIVLQNPNITVNSGSICAGGVFTMVPQGAATYTITGGSATVSPSGSTSYSVTGTSSGGCISPTAAVSNVIVFPPPAISVNGTTVVCIGKSTTLTAGGAANYVWSNSATTAVNVVAPTSYTTYTVSGTDVNGCQNSAQVSVSVCPLPTVSAQTSNTKACKNEQAVLTASGASSYSWSTGANTASISLIVTTAKVYTVTGTDANGCSSSTTIAQTMELCTGIQESGVSEAVKIYPNPSKGSFTIKATEPFRAMLYNELGQQLRVIETGKELNVPVEGLSEGIYFISISFGEQTVVKKMVVVR